MRPDAPESAGSFTATAEQNTPTGLFASSGGLDVASFEIGEGEHLHIGVPMCETIALELTTAGCPNSEYIEIPIEHVGDLVAAITRALHLASVGVEPTPALAAAYRFAKGLPELGE